MPGMAGWCGEEVGAVSNTVSARLEYLGRAGGR